MYHGSHLRERTKKLSTVLTSEIKKNRRELVLGITLIVIEKLIDLLIRWLST